MSEGHSITTILSGLVWIFDLLTLPVYTLFQAPWKNVHDNKRNKALIINRTKDSITLRSTYEKETRLHKYMTANDINTLDKLFSDVIKRQGRKNAMGTREVLNEVETKTMGQTGKRVKQLTLGDYTWISYEEVGNRAELLGAGLRGLGAGDRERICIFAETSANWFTAAIACFKQNFTVVTLYATVGEEGLLHGLNETEAKFVLTTQTLLPKLFNNLASLPFVKTIVCLDDKPLDKEKVSHYAATEVDVHTFSRVLEMGHDENLASMAVTPPKPEDIAVIMYTSGSTGKPKGVLLSHFNIVSAVAGFLDGFHGDDITKNDVYMGYLPLAHIFEFAVESLYFFAGVPIGYGSPLTLVDGGPMLSPGCQGDASALRPTVMVIVPLLLERLYKGVLSKVSGGSPASQSIFHFFYGYKLKWVARGYGTPLVDAIVFRRIRNLLGGSVKLMASGSAPLSPKIHEFMRTTLCATIIQGYGLTETNANATTCINGDLNFGRIGRPLPGCDITLVDWEDGKCTVNDTPCPRGELVIGGPVVASGYYKMPELTSSDFFTDEEGKRWFRTGDIGEVHDDGVFKLIDRKKDLVKLQMGEFVSLGKVETTLKLNPYVENICVYVDPRQNSVIALVVPATNEILSLATTLIGKGGLGLEDLCRDAEIRALILQEIQKQGGTGKLSKYEIPAAIALIPDTWTPDSGLVTAALKLRRRNLQEFYQKTIDELYKSLADKLN